MIKESTKVDGFTLISYERKRVGVLEDICCMRRWMKVVFGLQMISLWQIKGGQRNNGW
jgi:hypothetical protein